MREPAVDVTINYYQPDGPKETLISDASGWLEGAVCPYCRTTSIYVVQALRAYPAALAGSQMKIAAEAGVQLVCRNPECACPDSPVVTPRHHRSYE